MYRDNRAMLEEQLAGLESQNRNLSDDIRTLQNRIDGYEAEASRVRRAQAWPLRIASFGILLCVVPVITIATYGTSEGVIHESSQVWEQADQRSIQIQGLRFDQGSLKLEHWLFDALLFRHLVPGFQYYNARDPAEAATLTYLTKCQLEGVSDEDAEAGLMRFGLSEQEAGELNNRCSGVRGYFLRGGYLGH